MRAGLLGGIAAIVMLAGCAAETQTVSPQGYPVAKDAVVSTAMTVAPGDMARMQQVGSEILFWDQPTRERNFRNMEKIFPGYVVEAGSRVKALPAGVPLPVDGATIDAYMKANNVAGLIVLQDGRVRLERYGLGFGREGRWTSFSVAKSFTSTLVGAAIKDGFIQSVDEPVTRYIPELAGSGYDGVTIAQLLTMTSGVKWNESYTDPNSDVARMYATPAPAGMDATVAYMRTLPRETTPGEKFVYKTGETNLIGVLVSNAIGDRSIATYLSEKIWKPYGMEADAFWMTDPSGQEVSGCCLSVSLRDYARMGQFALEGGAGLVPEGWIAEATRAHVTLNAAGFGYGYQWWTYPGEMYGGQGIFGQSITVDPKTRTVVAIVSAWPRATGTDLTMPRLKFVSELMAAAGQ
ncbi:serine hydrolase [Sphingomonas sp. AX6]|uniref:serine hydrolase n=1 Tax=Sphingomonas sp. AX6 TaxID=2653171 RepID=UPI0012EF61D2|nr:serine hydrolase [Sphingomonas sp. AX6]VXD00039.1 6-aminohexanoate-dimer hydrolase [Sphingomonas sp. AX6]